MSIQTLIGKSRNDATGQRILPPTGMEIPRPFDIRHLWRQQTGRDIGGIVTLGDLEGQDWIYGASSDIVAQWLTHFDRDNPRVWLYLLDPYTNDGAWYEGTMLEPHIERGGGTTLSTLVVPFRNMERYT